MKERRKVKGEGREWLRREVRLERRGEDRAWERRGSGGGEGRLGTGRRGGDGGERERNSWVFFVVANSRILGDKYEGFEGHVCKKSLTLPLN